MIFSVIPYNTLKLLKYCIFKKVGFKIQPERFLNLFLIFGEKIRMVSYKLVSYRKKRVVIILIPILHNLLSYTPQFIRRRGMVIKGLKRGRNLRGFGCPNSVPIGKSPIAWDKRTEKHIGFLCSPFSFI